MKQPTILSFNTLNAPVQLATGQQYQGVGPNSDNTLQGGAGQSTPLEPLMAENGQLRDLAQEQRDAQQQQQMELTAERLNDVRLHSVFCNDADGKNVEIVVDTPFTQLSQGGDTSHRRADFSYRRADQIEALQLALDVNSLQVVGNVIDAQQRQLGSNERRITGYTLQIQ